LRLLCQIFTFFFLKTKKKKLFFKIFNNWETSMQTTPLVVCFVIVTQWFDITNNLSQVGSSNLNNFNKYVPTQKKKKNLNLFFNYRSFVNYFVPNMNRRYDIWWVLKVRLNMIILLHGRIGLSLTLYLFNNLLKWMR
jgi:hypothetical protein